MKAVRLPRLPILRRLVAILVVGQFGMIGAGSAAAQVGTEAAETRYRVAIEDARAGRTAQALAVLRALTERFPERQDILGDYAVVLGWAGNDFAALAIYQSILDKDPAQRAALRGKIHTLGRLGTPRLALELADRNPGLLSPEERSMLAADRTAQHIRWGAIAADSGRGPGRFEGIDRALADSDAAGARRRRLPQPRQPRWKTAGSGAPPSCQ